MIAAPVLESRLDSAEADRGAPALGRWLSLVGIGEDGIAGLSQRAADVIRRAPLVVGGARHLDLASALIAGDRLGWMSPIEATFPSIMARRGQPTCILATGDPFHYGIGATLARLVPAGEIDCLPQPSAFSLAAARLGWALQDCTCISLHGRPLERVVPVLQPGRRLLVLSWDRTTPRALASLLDERGFGPSPMTVCEAMGGPSEHVSTGLAQAFEVGDIADLNTIAVDLRAAPEARIRALVPGLPDAWIEHDGQITKAPIRAVTLSALAPRYAECLWDVGGGSGSVTIDWLLTDASATAVTIERHSDRFARLMRNARHWGVADRVRPVQGEAPACLAGLPTPDAIFIGGGVTAPGMIEVCRAALRAGGRLVVNAVTLESQAVLTGLLSRIGGEILTLSVAKAEPVGGFHGLRPAMPVMQWRWIAP